LEKALALRRLRYNGWRIAQALHLSPATVSRILRRNGMNRLRSLDPPPPVVRYEHKRPGDLIHFVGSEIGSEANATPRSHRASNREDSKENRCAT
jgi:hypothetical protein